jgi:hypothetical protein
LLGPALLFACSSGNKKYRSKTADAIYFNGRIITLEGDAPT